MQEEEANGFGLKYFGMKLKVCHTRDSAYQLKTKTCLKMAVARTNIPASQLYDEEGAIALKKKNELAKKAELLRDIQKLNVQNRKFLDKTRAFS
ncbi:hypothetical protein RRG08_051380 [Elysia crispata]|uniref:Uncharacterized protein n=1 Tax=Elysia crispata TaxID=231223 RepID=A0AAE1B3S2_9GAST|nr:hypothetical protein RRG08_051380 [Elysia crispata]